jgi:hypothetical protein
MVLTGSLADALLGSDSTSQDNPGSQSDTADNSSTQVSASSDDSGAGLEALAQPMPDTSSLPPNSTTPTQDSQQPALSPQSNPAQNQPLSAAPPPGLKGLGGRLRGVLYGLATGGVPGAIAGSIDPSAAQTRYVQNQDMRQAKVAQAQLQNQQTAQNIQFESVKAADSHIQAMKTAQNADLLNQESRIEIAQKNADYAAYLQNQFGIAPDVKISGNGQEVHDQAIAAHGTLAAENGGQIPPVQANVMPHTPGKPTFDIGVYAPSQQDLQRNPTGFRKIVDTQRAVQGLPPIDDLSWTSGGGKGYQGQRMMVLDAQKFLSPLQDFTEQSLPAVLAQRKQQLAAYQGHTDGNGQPDADPGTVRALQSSVDLLSKAQDDVNASKAQAAASQITAETPAKTAQEVAIRKATLPFDLAKVKAEEAVKDGDPAAAGALLYNGDVAPSQIANSRKPAFAQQAFDAAKNLAKQNGTQWDAQSAEGYFKVAQSPENVKFFGSAGSMVDKGGTIDQAMAAYEALPNGRIPIINKGVNWADRTIGGAAPKGFQATVLGLADDYAKVMGGGQGSDSSRNAVLDSLAASQSNGQMRATLSGMRDAVTSQMSSRIGSNPVLRRMYGGSIPPPPQAGEQSVKDKTGRVIGYTTDGKNMRPI